MDYSRGVNGAAGETFISTYIVSTGLPSHNNSASIVICYVIVLLMDGIIVKINDSHLFW